jgi:putative integral membrane protein (TIGR02587 family)
MKSVSDSLKEYARGITGGLLFSLPLLYTMEMWWLGFSIQPYQLLIYIVITFLLLLGYNYYAGVHEDATWKEVMIDSVEEIGIGFILSLMVLWLLGRIDFTGMTLEEIMGKTILETMTVAIGVSIGTAQLGGDSENNNVDNKERNLSSSGHALLALCGSVLIAGNIAPTEEIPMIAMETTSLRLIMLVIVSLFLGAVILFFSNFKKGSKLPSGKIAVAVMYETFTAYIIALSSSAFMLWFFGRFNGIHFSTALSQMIILGMPAILGASAGRLLIKS